MCYFSRCFQCDDRSALILSLVSWVRQLAVGIRISGIRIALEKGSKRPIITHLLSGRQHGPPTLSPHCAPQPARSVCRTMVHTTTDDPTLQAILYRPLPPLRVPPPLCVPSAWMLTAADSNLKRKLAEPEDGALPPRPPPLCADSFAGSDSDTSSIGQAPTNRGRKLKRHARSVHRGRLAGEYGLAVDGAV